MSISNLIFRLINHDQSTVSGLSKTYEPVDKEISCDIDIVSIRTMEAKGMNVEPSNEAVLILHRQGFNNLRDILTDKNIVNLLDVTSISRIDV